ncbi:MAG: hypothetical protein PWR10_1526 [Halanaerobiales bacterium]|nr:hypothetical protein [Halanaerobiales bacterium]
MIIKEINKGNKIPYSINENQKTITFNDRLTINLEENQADVEVVIDISLNKNMELIQGVDKWYVANLIIPAAEYELIDTGEVDENNQPIMENTKKELSLDEVKLILWGLPGEFNITDGGIK